MPYETYMGTYIDENDHNLQRKFGYKYRALKGIYPDAYKLPETEVSKAIDVFYEGDANEDVTTMTDRVRNYTTSKDQEWKAKYFGEASKPKPQESYSSTTIKAPSGFAQVGGSSYDNYFIDKMYNHLKRDEVEGYFNRMYCDNKGYSTVGVGTLLSNRKDLDNYTITTFNEPVSENNPMWTASQKDQLWRTHRDFCTSDENNKKLYAKAQFDKYTKQQTRELPYFKDEELEPKVKNYIRQELPHLVNMLANEGIDFYNDLNLNRQIAFMDMLYNLGRNKFKLGDGPVEKGYWPKLTKGLRAKNYAEVAKHSYRPDVHMDRNNLIYNYFLG